MQLHESTSKSFTLTVDAMHALFFMVYITSFIFMNPDVVNVSATVVQIQFLAIYGVCISEVKQNVQSVLIFDS